MTITLTGAGGCGSGEKPAQQRTGDGKGDENINICRRHRCRYLRETVKRP